MLKVYKGKRYHSERDFRKRRHEQRQREYNKYMKYKGR